MLVEQKLNVVIMGENCEKFIGMCLESVKGADSIIYCDGGSEDNTLTFVENFFKFDGPIPSKIIHNEFDQEDKLMNSKQKNFFLDYLKKNHMNEWFLYLDADEVVSDFNKIRKFINNPPEKLKELISIKMRHFENNLGFEDATKQEHYVPNRLFKVKEELFFPDGEHTVLWIKKDGVPLLDKELSKYCGMWKGITIWHLAYCSGIWDFRKRYLNNLKKSEIHPKDFMEKWYFNHLFGIYPTKPINAMEIPNVILKEFLIDPDKVYFMNRGILEVKHFMMSKQWLEYFKPKNILDLGCGYGHFGYCFKFLNENLHYLGIEKSGWAIEKTPYKNLTLEKYDIRDPLNLKDFDLVLCIDILEHLEEKDLDQVLGNLKTYGKKFLFSIPYLGNPELDIDLTHKIKKEKTWWVNKLSNYFKISEVPDNFLYKHQMLMGENK